MTTDIDYLVLSGAGLAGISFLGALYYIINKTPIGYKARHVVGTSAGSIMALLYVLRVKPETVRAVFSDINSIFERNSIASISKLLYNSTSGSGFGYIDKKELSTLLCNITGLCDTITFDELHSRTGRYLYVVTTDICTGDPVIFSHLTTPKMNVLEAIGISCSIPFVFKCTKMTDEYDIERLLVDGGVSHCYPLELVDGGRGWNRRAIGITTMHHGRWIQDKAAKDIGMASFVVGLMNAMTRRIFQLQASLPGFKQRTIAIDVGTVDAITPVSKERASMLFDAGYFAAEDFFKDTFKRDLAGSSTDVSDARIFTCHTDLGGFRDFGS